jgi:hypothetical protein
MIDARDAASGTAKSNAPTSRAASFSGEIMGYKAAQ